MGHKSLCDYLSIDPQKYAGRRALFGGFIGSKKGGNYIFYGKKLCFLYISEPTRQTQTTHAAFSLKKKK